MECREATTQILELESAGGTLDGALAQHLEGCAECKELLVRVRKLDSLAKGMPKVKAPPVPALVMAAVQEAAGRQAAGARAGDAGDHGRRQAGPYRFPGAMKRSIAAAAVLVVGVGIALVMLMNSSRVAAAEVLSHLVEWNTKLVAVEDLVQRKAAYSAQAQSLESEVKNARLSGQDLETATVLLDNAKWLAEGNDWVEGTRRFVKVADSIASLRQAQAAQSAAYNQMYLQVQQGLSASMKRVNAATLTPDQTRTWNDVRQQAERHLQAPEPIKPAGGAMTGSRIAPVARMNAVPVDVMPRQVVRVAAAPVTMPPAQVVSQLSARQGDVTLPAGVNVVIVRPPTAAAGSSEHGGPSAVIAGVTGQSVNTGVAPPTVSVVGKGPIAPASVGLIPQQESAASSAAPNGTTVSGSTTGTGGPGDLLLPGSGLVHALTGNCATPSTGAGTDTGHVRSNSSDTGNVSASTSGNAKPEVCEKPKVPTYIGLAISGQDMTGKVERGSALVLTVARNGQLEVTLLPIGNGDHGKNTGILPANTPTIVVSITGSPVASVPSATPSHATSGNSTGTTTPGTGVVVTPPPALAAPPSWLTNIPVAEAGDDEGAGQMESQEPPVVSDLGEIPSARPSHTRGGNHGHTPGHEPADSVSQGDSPGQDSTGNGATDPEQGSSGQDGRGRRRHGGGWHLELHDGEDGQTWEVDLSTVNLERDNVELCDAGAERGRKFGGGRFSSERGIFGQSLGINSGTVGDTVDVGVTALTVHGLAGVPEPATGLVLLAGVGMLLVRARRQRQ